MIINLKEFYPAYYTQDCFVEVEKEVAFALHNSLNVENRWQGRRKYNKAVYSLDTDDNIEASILTPPPGTPEIVESDALSRKLKLAFETLSDKQIRRIMLHVLLDMKYSEIAKLEDIKEAAVRQSITAGLQKLKKLFEDS